GYWSASRLVLEVEPLLVHDLAALAVHVLALPEAPGCLHPGVGGEAVAERIDRTFAVRSGAGHADHRPNDASASEARRATYSSTHSGKIRRDRSSLSDRSSPV